MDPFEQALQDVPEEGGQFEDLPLNCWILGRTATEENGGAAPGIRENDKPQIWHAFKVGLIALGGDAKIEERTHGGRMAFFDTSLTDKDKPGKLGGRITGFLNAVFAVGVDSPDKQERHAKRWGLTLEALKQGAKDGDLSFDQFEAQKERGVDPMPLFLTSCAVEAMKKESRTILFKLGKSKKDYIEVKAFEDDTQENRQKRHVVPFGTGEQTRQEF
jgi:hypothetical protein